MTNVFQPRFQNEDAAREHLEALHWPEGPFCPHCGSVKATRLPPQKGRKTKAHPEGAIRKGVVQCNDCRQQYTVTVGTVFESSKVPLHKWLYVNHVLCSSKKGTSAHQIARNIGVSYKTAWFMMHRIREAMKETHGGPMGGYGETIEADETFVGGKVKNRSNKQRRVRQGEKFLGPVHGKQPVVSLVERGGKVRSFHVANVTGETLRAILVTNADRGSWLMTDEHSGYRDMKHYFAGHGTTSHGRGQYVDLEDRTVHSNTVEGYFSIFKRGMKGVYQFCGEQHLHRYLAEFEFRYNNRIALGVNDQARADNALAGIVGKRLTYGGPANIA